jgi:thiamine transport system permease protein
MSLGPEFFWVLKNTIVQSSLSALGTIVLAIFGALGLIGADPFKKKIITSLCVIPFFLPSSLMIVFTLGSFTSFPFGLIGVIVLHIIINLGFITVLVAQAMEDNWPQYEKLRQVFGVGKWTFYKASMGLIRTHLIQYFWMVFIFSFTSFSIPLIIGGGSGTSIEVLIFEKLKISHDWISAIALSLIQFFILYFLQSAFSKKPITNTLNSSKKTLEVHSKGLFIFTSLISVIPIFLIIESSSNIVFSHTFLEHTFNSILLMLFNILWVSLFLGIYLILEVRSSRLINFINTPLSSMVIGPMVYMLMPAGNIWSYINTSFCLALLTFPFLIKIQLKAATQALSRQILVAQQLGASDFHILKMIVAPQIRGPISQVLAVSSVWAMGDFAISSIFFEMPTTLGLTLKNLLGSYRLNEASGAAIILLGMSAILYFSIRGLLNDRN